MHHGRLPQCAWPAVRKPTSLQDISKHVAAVHRNEEASVVQIGERQVGSHVVSSYSYCSAFCEYRPGSERVQLLPLTRRRHDDVCCFGADDGSHCCPLERLVPARRPESQRNCPREAGEQERGVDPSGRQLINRS
jgi:hypothetical protein